MQDSKSATMSPTSLKPKYHKGSLLRFFVLPDREHWAEVISIPISLANMFFLGLCTVTLTLIYLSSCFPSEERLPLQKAGRSPFTPNFDKHVTQLMNVWHVPGIAIAIVDGNETFSKVRIGKIQIRLTPAITML